MVNIILESYWTSMQDDIEEIVHGEATLLKEEWPQEDRRIEVYRPLSSIIVIKRKIGFCSTTYSRYYKIIIVRKPRKREIREVIEFMKKEVAEGDIREIEEITVSFTRNFKNKEKIEEEIKEEIKREIEKTYNLFEEKRIFP